MEKIIGKWTQIEGQAYAGLWFNFKEDGTFDAEYAPLGVVSSGTYEIDGNQIDMDQKKHTFGLLGHFRGIYEIDGDELKLALASGAGQERPTDLTGARIYKKE
ncbi:MAG: hypothetical protein V2J07_07100 [Anaerolineae bacterium]|jgi:hypothetical protein|nr:hypothetical protein [Anaerolineae bacterium]